MKITDDVVAVKAAHLTTMVFKYINQDKKSTYDENSVVALSFMATFLYTLIQRQLLEKAPAGLSKQQVESHVVSEYTDLKHSVQNAVAAAFQAALTEYSGRSCEYYCQIKPMPAVANKQPC